MGPGGGTGKREGKAPQRTLRGRLPGRALWVVGLLVVGAIAVGIYAEWYFRTHHWDPHAACLSNLRQISAGLRAYAEDHDGVYPGSRTWRLDLDQYMLNLLVFQCPLTDRTDMSYAHAAPSYAYAEWLSARSPAHVPSGGQTPALWDMDVDTGEPAFRHKRGINVAYVDGRVEWLPADAFGAALQDIGAR